MGFTARPTAFGTKYPTEEWKVGKISAPDNAATLDAKQWTAIANANKIYHGYVVGPKGLIRARFPAFEPKATEQDVSPIPHYEVFDQSSISIRETKNETERSFVHNGFSSWHVEGEIGGSYRGITAALAASYNTETQENYGSGRFQEHTEYVAEYKFPRARVFVDDLDLVVTKRCSDMLKQIETAVNSLNSASADKKREKVEQAIALRQQFFREYGTIYCTTFQLGGVLTASRHADSFASTDDSVRRDAMKVAAALSIESKWVSASASGGYEQSRSDARKNVDINNNAALAWNARGGNTLLCQSPAEWANSLADSATWRTLEQGDILCIPSLIGKLANGSKESQSAVPGLFRSISTAATWLEDQKLPYNHRIRLIPAGGGRRLVWDGAGRLTMTDDLDLPSAMFILLDGNIDGSHGLGGTQTCWPFFFVTNENYSSQTTIDGGQIPGVWVDNSGYIRKESGERRICRWSLRKEGQPMNLTTKLRWGSGFEDGDIVYLQCHSYRSGAYVTPDRPPYFAPMVCSNGRELRVMDHGQSVFYEESMRKIEFQPPFYTTHMQYTKPPPNLWNREKKELRFCFGLNQIQDLMTKLDHKNLSDAIEKAELETFQALYGVYDEDNAKECARKFFATRDSGELSTGKPPENVAIPAAAFVPESDPVNKATLALYQRTVDAAIRRGREEWKKTTGFTEEMKFVVKYA